MKIDASFINWGFIEVYCTHYTHIYDLKRNEVTLLIFLFELYSLLDISMHFKTKNWFTQRSLCVSVGKCNVRASIPTH